MKKKIFNYILIVVALSTLIFMGTEYYNNFKNKGLYGETLKTINAQDIFPHAQSIDLKIAVIDTGINTTNKFLKDAKINQEYLESNQGLSQQMHGTMVGGILVSTGNGHTTPGGLIPNTSILSIQAGTDMGMTSEQLAKAINTAVSKNVDIINISLATPKNTIELENAIKSAIDKNIIVVAAAENNDPLLDYYPISYEGVIGVGAVDNNRRVVDTPNIDNIDIFASGSDLLTTESSDNGLTYFTGSSATAPLVTAFISVLKSKKPDLDSKEILELMKRNGSQIEINNKSGIILNAEKTLRAVD